MLEPTLPPTRGLPIIRTRAGLEERALVGRVHAPAGHEGGELFFLPRV